MAYLDAQVQARLSDRFLSLPPRQSEMPSVDVPVVTGYYRFTDIWFEWHQAIPEPDDRAPLKAILAHDSLVHPDHPLHIDGVKGIQLYIGTFQTGEARLLYSSKQIDYIRYWLHAMQITKSMVPLPYSDCLLTEANLRTVSPVVYPDGFALKNALKAIDKNNKRLKGSNPLLTHRRHVFERVRAFWAQKKGIWIALDFEAWERDHKLITEFGWSLISWHEDGSKTEEQGHLINEAAKGFVNSTYLVDNRHHYNFGVSKTLKKTEFIKAIHDLLSKVNQQQPVFLTFHDNNQDIKYLNEIGVDLTGLTYLLPEAMPLDGIFVVDTADLIGALLGEGDGNKRGLEKTCNLLQIATEYLHNAGNDAHYTLLAMQSMASGDPLDIQREKRWPNQTVTGVQVNLKPWQEDSDYSDEEGVFEPIRPPVPPVDNSAEGAPAAAA